MKLNIIETVKYPNKEYMAVVYKEGTGDFSVIMMYNPAPHLNPHEYYWDSKPLKALSELHAQEILSYLIEVDYAEKGIDLYLKH